MKPLSLWEQAQALLESVLGQLDSPPARAYVADGVPAFDCEQLTLHLRSISRGTSQEIRPAMACAPTTVTAIFTRTWCVPVIEGQNVPSVALLAASGKQVTDGGEELWKAVATALSDLKCSAAMDVAEAAGPEGGFASWAITVRWTL